MLQFLEYIKDDQNLKVVGTVVTLLLTVIIRHIALRLVDRRFPGARDRLV